MCTSSAALICRKTEGKKVIEFAFFHTSTLNLCGVVCGIVLQCVAVCCSVLQCVAVCCSVLQCVAVCCSVLQCVAVCCSVLQCARQETHRTCHLLYDFSLANFGKMEAACNSYIHLCYLLLYTPLFFLKKKGDLFYNFSLVDLEEGP